MKEYKQLIIITHNGMCVCVTGMRISILLMMNLLIIKAKNTYIQATLNSHSRLYLDTYSYVCLYVCIYVYIHTYRHTYSYSHEFVREQERKDETVWRDKREQGNDVIF